MISIHVSIHELLHTPAGNAQFGDCRDCEAQICNYIKPNLGDVPLLLLFRDASARLETFYARLRRCLSPPLFRKAVY